ncbi:MAG: DKNYY domain-containing protein [Candidatus Gracilibacteria bacterium]
MKKPFLIIFSILLTLNSVSALSESEQINASNFLASKSYISDFSGSTNEYRINDNISRKEVMKVIINLARENLINVEYDGFNTEYKKTIDGNKCELKFKDVINDWGCKYIETALATKFIESQDNFRPDDNITVNEVLKLIFKAKKIEKKYNTGDWGKDYLDTAKDLGLIIDDKTDGGLQAKRGFIFLVIANSFDYFESYQEGKDNVLFKENKTDFYGIDFNLKTINSNKYELIGENIPSDVSSIEILSCKDNFLDTYDSNWYSLKSFKIGNSSFKYTIDKNFNNYCTIPYKIRLNYMSGETKTVDLNLNLSFIKAFAHKILFGTGNITQFNLNTIRLLSSYGENVTIIDKNNMYQSYNGWPEAGNFSFKVDDYLSYKYVGDILIGDNYVIADQHAFVNYGEKLFQIDGNTFEKFGTGYYKDKDNYYTNSSKIGEVTKNLKILSDGVCIFDGKYYYQGNEMEIGDKDTFSIINDENHEKEFQNGLIIYTVFAKDKNNLYITSFGYGNGYVGKFKGDYDSYKVINGNMAIDKYTLFFANNNGELKTFKHSFDISTLESKENNNFSDKNGEYYLDEEKGIIKK